METSIKSTELVSAQGLVELSPAQLHLVGGGLPKGTWSEVEGLPKGTWDSAMGGEDNLPKGTW